MSSLRAAIYVRVSTLEQAGDDATSLDLQEERCVKFAESQGWDVVEVYREEGYTGTVSFKTRPVGARLMTDATLGKFDYVVTYNISRFSRSIRYFVEDSSELEDLGIHYASVQEQFDTSNPVGRMVRVLLVAFAEFEAAQIKERMASGKLGGLRAGRWVTGPMSFGYEWTGEEAMVVEAEADVVHRIFELVSSGMSAHRTAAQLTAEGHKAPRGGEWSSTSIVRLVEKAGYMGAGFENEAAGETFVIDAPAIVDAEVWRKANSVLERIRERQLSRRRNTAEPYALSGRVLHVHETGPDKMNAKTRPSGRDGRARLYRCRVPECEGFADDKQGRKSVEAGGVEAWVLLRMLRWLEDPAEAARYVEAHDLRSMDSDSATEALRRIEEHLRDVQSRRDVLARLVASGQLPEADAKGAFESVREQEEELRESAERLRGAVDVEREVSNFVRGNVRDFMPGDVGPGDAGWASLSGVLMYHARSVVMRYIERCGIYGPGKPEKLDLEPWAVEWADSLAELFDVNVFIGDSVSPDTWEIEGTVGVGPDGTPIKISVRSSPAMKAIEAQWMEEKPSVESSR